MWMLWTIAIVLVIYLALFIVPVIAAYAAMWGETYRVSVPEFSDRDGISNGWQASIGKIGKGSIGWCDSPTFR